MLVNRKCKYCGKNFEAKTYKTKYCSHSCNAKHYKQRKKEDRNKGLIKENKQPVKSYQSLIEESQMREFLTIDKCAVLLDVGVSTIKRIIADGELKYMHIGQRVIISRKHINEYCKQQLENDKKKVVKKAIKKTKDPSEGFIKRNYYYIGEITKYYNMSAKSIDRYIKEHNLKKVKQGRFVYVLKSDIRKIFGAPIKLQ